MDHCRQRKVCANHADELAPLGYPRWTFHQCVVSGVFHATAVVTRRCRLSPDYMAQIPPEATVPREDLHQPEG
ncbi:unnamed protein product [Danaus chrysippus]|uniref:(African queen) hypothetical protein n=1 Tax=Danaus chrysippus TaxID=151541 RepID=A0A8J2QVI0_9NEOP|nr:unnamed protein product [Danaus chrysippus]